MRTTLTVAFVVVLLSTLITALVASPRASPTPVPWSVRDRRIVVVGSAPTVHDLGELIDSHEVVVRVNPLYARNTRHVGQRCDVVHVNHNLRPDRLRYVPRDGVREWWTRDGHATATQLRVPLSAVQVYDVRRMRNETPEVRDFRGKSMTSGMLVILHALQHAPRVYSAGISGYRVRGHASGTSLAAHERNLEKFHDSATETRILQRLVREGRLVMLCNAKKHFI